MQQQIQQALTRSSVRQGGSYVRISVVVGESKLSTIRFIYIISICPQKVAVRVYDLETRSVAGSIDRGRRTVCCCQTTLSNVCDICIIVLYWVKKGQTGRFLHLLRRPKITPPLRVKRGRDLNGSETRMIIFLCGRN